MDERDKDAIVRGSKFRGREIAFDRSIYERANFTPPHTHTSVLVKFILPEHTAKERIPHPDL